MTEPKLSKDEELVLRRIFDAKDDGAGDADAIAAVVGISKARVMRALMALEARGLIGRSSVEELSLADVDHALKSLDENADCDTASRVLMASLLIGAGDESRIAGLGMPAEDVRTVGNRLRRNGVWDAGGIDEPQEGTDFWLLVAIANGMIEREFDEAAGEWMYRNTPEGMKRAEQLLRRP